MIEIENLRKEVRSGDRTLSILNGITLRVRRGQALAITGPSGSGKSTLLGLIAGLDAATSGSIRVDGVEITGLDEDRLAALRGRSIGFVFQSYHLIPTLTALENVALPMELNGAARRGENAAQRGRQLLAAVGLAERAHHYPAQLSGGEQQRVAIARAFANRPAVLLADEPTGNLDSRTGEQVIELLLELNRQHGTTLVVVTHDPALAGRADRIVELRDGCVVADRYGGAAAAAREGA